MRGASRTLGLAGAVLWLAAPALAAGGAPLEGPELALRSGVVVTGTSYAGGSNAASFALVALEGRALLGAFTVEAGLQGLVPANAAGPLGSWGASLRLGVTLERFLITGGAWVNVTAAPGAVQVLPTLTAALALGPVVASLGVFDRSTLAPARLGVSWNGLGLGWVFPLGGEAFARFPVGRELTLEARVLGVQLFNAFTLAGLLGVAWGPR